MIAASSQFTNRFPPIVLDCACCEQRLADGADYCPNCETPASVSHSVATRVGEQNFISVLGASNAGKTVYLGLLLDILTNGPEEFRGTATSAFCVDLQEQVITALEQRRFPEKTAAEADTWNWLHCHIAMSAKKDTRHVDLISPDFAGEAIAMEVNQAGMYPAIQCVVGKSSGLMILCDSMRVRDAGSSEDLFALKLASYIAQMHGQGRNSGSGRGTEPSIAVVFTKCDGCPEAVDAPRDFAANNTPRLFEFCRRTFTRHAFFAASVAGSSGVLTDAAGRTSRVPFDVQPSGILEPVQWLVAGG